MNQLLQCRSDARFKQCFIHRFPGYITIQPHKKLGLRAHGSIRIKHINDLKSMPQTDFIIIDVMRRCHLQCTSTKSTINIPIAYDWNFPMDQRNNSFLAFKVSIPLIIGMNCNCCITKNGFRPGGGYSDPLIRGTGNLISDFVEYGFSSS